MSVDTRAIIHATELTKAQSAFLKMCQEVNYGTLEVKIRDGQPVMTKILEQWHKHD